MFRMKTEPFPHQQEEFNLHREARGWGRFWEQGTGKTKATLDEMGAAFDAGEVTHGVVVAPNNVHRNWITDEVPAHWPDDIPLYAHAFRSSDSISHRDACAELLRRRGERFNLLAISYDAWQTPRGKQLVWEVMRDNPTFLVADESARIKSPSAKRTRSVVRGGSYAKVRRALSGTPVAVGPFDLYSQVQFVDPRFWVREGFPTFQVYKSYFGVWTKGLRWDDRKQEYMSFDQLVGFQNLPQLNELLVKLSSRYTKDILNLPPKLYTRRYFEMESKQARTYQELEDEFYTFVGGELVSAPLAIVRQLRLQQVLCGYVPTDDGNEPVDLLPVKDNPALRCLREVVAEQTDKTIVWAIYDRDVDMIMEALRADGRRPVQYDGRVGERQRDANKVAFQSGDADVFVGKASTAGEGLTLHAAKTVVYYNNSFRYIDRKQSEDRAHRSGMDDRPVLYVDLVCSGTVMDRALRNLKIKHERAANILGDPVGGWL